MSHRQTPTHRARRILDAVAHAYPGAWSAFDAFKRDQGRSPEFDWPQWCYMPMAAGYAVVSGGGPNRVALAKASHPAIVTALGTWRRTQGIYRFDPALLDAVLATPLDGELPIEHLQHLPEWCVYIDLADTDLTSGGRRLYGAWVHMEFDVARNGAQEFRVVYDCAHDPRQPFSAHGVSTAMPLLLDAKTLSGAIDALQASDNASRKLMGIEDMPAVSVADLTDAMTPLRAVLSLALYLCADPDLAPAGHARTPSSQRPTSRRDIMSPASAPTQWDVGTRIGAALRAAYQREQTGGEGAPSGRQVRPHVRRAHWHTVLSGPRKREDGTEVTANERRRDLRWMPPIPVNVDDLDSLPAVIRPVPCRAAPS